MRYRLDLQYDGTDYHGLQIQPSAPSVEAEVENALATLLQKPIDVIGCGRTDTGVHASFYTAHFDTDLPVEPQNLLYKLQKILPPSIAIIAIMPVSEDFHARFSAISRSYIYRIIQNKDPFKTRHTYLYQGNIDLGLMNQSCQDLMGTHEFAAFCKGQPSTDHYRCTISQACWNITDNGLEFHITANRFLRNMVRAIVGTQLEIGMGKISLEAHRKLIAGGRRSDAGKSVPAHGLTLSDVQY